MKKGSQENEKRLGLLRLTAQEVSLTETGKREIHIPTESFCCFPATQPLNVYTKYCLLSCLHLRQLACGVGSVSYTVCQTWLTFVCDFIVPLKWRCSQWFRLRSYTRRLCRSLGEILCYVLLGNWLPWFFFFFLGNQAEHVVHIISTNYHVSI